MLRVASIQNYIEHIYREFNTLITQVKQSRRYPYEIAGWVKKEQREKDILVYRVTATDKYISHFSVFEIYKDEELLCHFSPKEIKYITTLAVLLHYKKDFRYQVVWEDFRNKAGSAEIHFFDKRKNGVIKTSIDELEKNIALIDGVSSRDAYLLGKKMGIRERVKEEQIMAGYDSE